MGFKVRLIILASFLFGSFSHAELNDPTRPASFSAKKVFKQRAVNTLQLTSIWISNRTKRITLNGVTAKQGDIVLSNVKVLKILNDSVVIRQNGKVRKIYLLPSLQISRNK